jgi:hypothetical protein
MRRLDDSAGLQFCVPAFRAWTFFSVCGCGSVRAVGTVRRASCRMGNFRQIRSIYGATQLVLAESDGSDPGYRRDLRRDNSWYFAGAGMADAGRSSLQWSFASAICGHDGSRTGNQGTFRLLGLFGRGGSFSSGLLRRISIQHRSTAAY